MEVLAVGDTVCVSSYGMNVTGDVVFIFGANRQPTEEDIKEYYGLEPGDKHYSSVNKAVRYDRAAVSKGNGHHIVIPVSPTFRGSCIILRRG